MYRLGRGIQRDVLEAKRWYERAAALGYAPAQYQLGVMWERGDGVPADPVEARGWFARAAQQNFEPARDALELIEQALAGRSRPLRAPPVNPSGEAAANRPPPARPAVNAPVPPPAAAPN
jgi:TPR repeat protein